MVYKGHISESEAQGAYDCVGWYKAGLVIRNCLDVPWLEMSVI